MSGTSSAYDSPALAVCDSCGSNNVVVDAWAEWDFKKQRWQLAAVFESTAFCGNCDGECSVREAHELLTG